MRMRAYVCVYVRMHACVTHLATAVKANSTFSPDLALVSMKGTPNSCTQKQLAFVRVLVMYVATLDGAT